MPQTVSYRMAIAQGMNGTIIGPLDLRLMENIIAVVAPDDRDSFCMNYLKTFQAGVFE